MRAKGIKLIDQEGNDVQCGERGGICLKSEWKEVRRRYGGEGGLRRHR